MPGGEQALALGFHGYFPVCYSKPRKATNEGSLIHRSASSPVIFPDASDKLDDGEVGVVRRNSSVSPTPTTNEALSDASDPEDISNSIATHDALPRETWDFPTETDWPVRSASYLEDGVKAKRKQAQEKRRRRHAPSVLSRPPS